MKKGPPSNSKGTRGDGKGPRAWKGTSTPHTGYCPNSDSRSGNLGHSFGPSPQGRPAESIIVALAALGTLSFPRVDQSPGGFAPANSRRRRFALIHVAASNA